MNSFSRLGMFLNNFLAKNNHAYPLDYWFGLLQVEGSGQGENSGEGYLMLESENWLLLEQLKRLQVIGVPSQFD